jgi:hypothetical protein
MATRKSFEAVIQEGRGGGAFVEVPFDVKALYGAARPRVKVTFDGEPYRGSIAPMGGASLIGVLKEIRGKIGKDIGDKVKVTIEPDTEMREVVVPEDVRKALKGAGREADFKKLSYTHQKEHISAIEEAKRAQTRQRRIEKMLEMLQTRRR